ncbi:hypothetical protein FHS00_001816 [Limimaricola variabilis]|uniref:EF-hand domain-containing protein n=1 Tax=Limimaricola variabilis TaxID=1492771 RepID=A0ABR6HNV3_9RHOB|nr:hypothetical protein [Limimaricola variabilis]MBB3712239.1 hypothetical protein [Limimaricola variabilis]
MLTKIMTVAASTAFVLSATTAVAQRIPFAEIDVDSDSMLSNEELVAAFGADGAATLMADDSNDDGMLSMQEIRVTADMDTAEPTERAESLDTEDPDYRDEETPLNPTTDFGEGFIEEEDESEGDDG